MRAISKLSEVRPWCLKAAEGDQVDFSLSGEATQEEGSQLAKEINKDRDGHVWIEVRQPVFLPELTTPIHIRCSA